MRSEILDKNPAARLRVYAVWFDVLRGDSRQLVDLRALSDERVTNFWDEKKTVARWFSEHVMHERGITWDAYFLYGPDARWETTPEPLLSSGATVISSSEQLAAAVAALLKGG